jgi:atypical dual specificity phosphatase
MKITWIIEGVLAISPFPHTSNLKDLYYQGIRAIVSLESHDEFLLRKMGFEQFFVYVSDYAPPHFCQLIEINEFIDRMSEIGKPVLIHCYAGGRSGTAAACYLIHNKGKTANEALREIREKFPNSVETASQERALEEFEVLSKRSIIRGKFKCLKRKILLKIHYIFKIQKSIHCIKSNQR